MKYLAEDIRGMFVIVCGERVDVQDVEFLSISKGFMDEDIMTFQYEGEVYESAVFPVRS